MYCMTLKNCLSVLLDPVRLKILEPNFTIDMRTFPNFSTQSAKVIESGKIEYNCTLKSTANKSNKK